MILGRCQCHCGGRDPFLTQCFRTMDPIGNGAVDTPTDDATYSPFTRPNGSVAVVSSNTWAEIASSSFSPGSSEPYFGTPEANPPWTPMALSELKQIVSDNQGLAPVNDPEIDGVYFENSIRFKMTNVRPVMGFFSQLDRDQTNQNITLPSSSHLDEAVNTTTGVIGQVLTPTFQTLEAQSFYIRAYQLRIDGTPLDIVRRPYASRSLAFDHDFDTTLDTIDDSVIEVDVWVAMNGLTNFTTFAPGISFTIAEDYPTFMTHLATPNGNSLVPTPFPPYYFPTAKFNADNLAARKKFHVVLASAFHGRTTFDDSAVAGWTLETTDTTHKWIKTGGVELLLDWSGEFCRVTTREDGEDYPSETMPYKFRRYVPPDNSAYPDRSDTWVPGSWDHTTDVTFVNAGESTRWGVSSEYRYRSTIDGDVALISPTVKPGATAAGGPAPI